MILANTLIAVYCFLFFMSILIMVEFVRYGFLCALTITFDIMCRSIGAQALRYFDGVHCLFIHVYEGVLVAVFASWRFISAFGLFLLKEQ